MKVVLAIGGNAPTRDEKLKTYPTGGPSGMRWAAYWEPGYMPCEDGDCPYCRDLIQGFGATEAEAIANYWEQWDEKEAERLDVVRLTELERLSGNFEPEEL